VVWSHPGEIAAVATAFLWTGSAVSFEIAGRRVGSLNVNLLRLVLACAFFALQGLAFHGRLLPLDADPSAWLWFSASALAGFVIGDLALFRALVLIGARLAMLLMALSPPLTALLSWVALGEDLTAVQVAGMALTLGGIAWAVLETPTDGRVVAGRGRWLGVLLGVAGAAGQAVGLVMSKVGTRTLDDPFAAAQIRALTGLAGFAVIFTLARQWSGVAGALKDRRGMGILAIGAICGPFLGVSMSLLAVRLTATGVASTIMSTTPILVIPAVVVLHRERVSVRAVGGALLAVVGVAMLFL
jgi:drug/metabolite transporter (DMT)-like permease